MLAAVGCGEFRSPVECCETFYRRDRVFEPAEGRHARYEAPYARYVELHTRLYG